MFDEKKIKNVNPVQKKTLGKIVKLFEMKGPIYPAGTSMAQASLLDK